MIASNTENATSYVESTGTSELNRFLNLVLKQPWEQMTHSMIKGKTGQSHHFWGVSFVV